MIADVDPNGHRRPGGIAIRDHVVARLAARDAVASGALFDPPEPPATHAGTPPTAEPDGDGVVPFTPIRRRTAEHLVRSLATAAHTLVVTEVDYIRVEAARTAPGWSYLPFVTRAVVDGLARFPQLNASVVDDGLRVHHHVNVGIAVDLDFQGLVVPVIHDADELRLGALAGRIGDLAARARAHHLTPHDVEGGTFTITNAGGHGTVVTGPIINQPQVAIVSTDGVRMRPVAVPDPVGGWQVAVRPVGNLSLSFDHRAVDGAYAAAFLAAVRETLEQRDWAVEVG